MFLGPELQNELLGGVEKCVRAVPLNSGLDEHRGREPSEGCAKEEAFCSFGEGVAGEEVFWHDAELDCDVEGSQWMENINGLISTYLTVSEDGCVISHFPKNAEPRKWMFVSGQLFCLGSLIVRGGGGDHTSMGLV